MSEIGQIVKRERLQRRLSQRKMAQRAGLSNTAISDVESGKNPRPSADLLVKAARGLGIEVAPLLVASGYLEAEALPSERFVAVPIIGVIHAGNPLLAIQEKDGEEEVSLRQAQHGNHYFLRVRGDSMTGLGIMPGSLVLVRNSEGEVPAGAVAVVIEQREDACVKIVKYDRDEVILRSANPDFPDRRLHRSEVQIIGEVVEVRTRYPLRTNGL